MSSKLPHWYVCLSLSAMFATISLPALAQDGGDQTATAEEALSQAKEAYGPPPPTERCTEEEDAATISGTIVVCRKLTDQSEYQTLDRKDAQRRYAEETMNQGNPRAPKFIRNCADQGWPVGCFRVGRVPPPALIIDVEALPEAPPGSDADRIARGLAPLGTDNPVSDTPVRVPIFPSDENPASPSSAESASPEGQP